MRFGARRPCVLCLFRRFYKFWNHGFRSVRQVSEFQSFRASRATCLKVCAIHRRLPPFKQSPSCILLRLQVGAVVFQAMHPRSQAACLFQMRLKVHPRPEGDGSTYKRHLSVVENDMKRRGHAVAMVWRPSTLLFDNVQVRIYAMCK